MPILETLPNNLPVADLQCPSCLAQYELKATASKFGRTITDGAYQTMLKRLASSTNPHLLLMQYDRAPKWEVRDLLIVPNFLFVPELIQARKPLSLTARRAGWQGCNILFGEVPVAGRVYLLSDRKPIQMTQVRSQWEQARRLFTQTNTTDAKSWTVSTLKCLDGLGQRFSLAEIYSFEAHLQVQFPKNRHIKAKLRQQMQILRDLGYVRFLGNGYYERLGALNDSAA